MLITGVNEPNIFFRLLILKQIDTQPLLLSNPNIHQAQFHNTNLKTSKHAIDFIYTTRLGAYLQGQSACTASTRP
jgi:hypothetical protein